MSKTANYDFLIDEHCEGLSLNQLEDFPELDIIYVSSEDHLCPKKVTCFWEGDINLTLDVNGEIITINDHDHKKNISHHVMVGDFLYTFQGRIKWPNQNPDTYLEVLITQEPIKRNPIRVKNHSKPIEKDIEHHKLGETFKIELSSNASTGNQWIIEETPNLKIVKEGYRDDCPRNPPRPGCGGYKIFFLKGLKKGPAAFRAKYMQTWAPSEYDTYKNIEFMID